MTLLGVVNRPDRPWEHAWPGSVWRLDLVDGDVIIAVFTEKGFVSKSHDTITQPQDPRIVGGEELL